MDELERIRKNLETYPCLKEYIEPKIEALTKKNHPLISCLKKNTPIVKIMDNWLRTLNGHPGVSGIMKDLLARPNIEQFQDCLAELEFAAYFFEKGCDVRIIPKDTAGTPDLFVSINGSSFTVEIKRFADPFENKNYQPGNVMIVDDIRKVHDKIDDSLKKKQFVENTPHIILFRVCAGLSEGEIIDLLYQKKGVCEISVIGKPDVILHGWVPYNGIFLEESIQEETRYNLISGVGVRYISTSTSQDMITGEIHTTRPRFVYYPNPFAKYSLNRDILKKLGFAVFLIE